MKRITQLAITLLLALGAPGLAIAAGGGGAPIVLVADTRKLTGIMAWWANLYNESHLYFTILTVIMIPTIGVIFGVLADIVMHWIGLDLKSRELAEH
ncbi:DVU0150 family protein [Fundidesulfovibrio agrisoli]|uniref:DVU0150 family protein n=1 Tax=Fundidesulfovibrio agrisoli TaxID=2922717 RepID=UPI001FAC5F53|nr:DVU0150 family protein [Fundidesulfovibrio agrisoli]